MLEYAALLAVKSQDIQSFERSLLQLQSYYSGPEPSRLKHEIQGLNLLRLLATGKISEFHTELELIPMGVRTSDMFIQYPVAMEQYMMEGAYHKVIQSIQKVPSPYYSFFAQLLGEAVRTQIAECIGRAYARLSFKEVAELLMVKDEKDLVQYEKQFDWIRNANGGYDFAKAAAEARVPKEQIMTQTLALAEELERIV